MSPPHRPVGSFTSLFHFLRFSSIHPTALMKHLAYLVHREPRAGRLSICGGGRACCSGSDLRVLLSIQLLCCALHLRLFSLPLPSPRARGYKHRCAACRAAAAWPQLTSIPQNNRTQLPTLLCSSSGGYTCWGPPGPNKVVSMNRE